MFDRSERTASRARLTAPARRAAAVLFEPVERRVLLSAAGQPDPSFGTNGTATAAGRFDAVAQAVQSDGKVVVESYAAATTTASSQIELTRFNANGTPDATFGAGGVATYTYLPTGAVKTYLPAYTGGESVLAESDAKLLVTGTAQVDEGNRNYSPYRPFAIQFNADGSVDSSYDQNSACNFCSRRAGPPRTTCSPRPRSAPTAVRT